MGRASVGLVLATLAFGLSGCSPPAVDVSKTLRITDLTTGWYDAGIVEGGKNKLVPSVAFRLNNAGARFSGSVQINAVFRRLGETEEWGSALIRAVDANGLAAGAATSPIVLRSNLGYTGTDPRAQLLQNRLFVDAKVQLFAKHGAVQWAKLGEYRVDRQILAH